MSEQVKNHDAAVEESVVLPGPLVGEQLRFAREARGLQIADIAQTLKLGPRQVEALEGGDWKGLPGNTFIRGFVRNYARLVQIDPAPLMAQLDQVLDKPVNSLAVPEVAPATMPHSGTAVTRRSKLVVLVGAGLVGLAALASFVLPSNLSSLREDTQSLLDSLARKDAPVQPAAEPAPEPVFPPGTTPQQVMNPQAQAPAEAAAPAAPPAEAAATPPAPVPPSSPETRELAAAKPASTAPQMRFVFDKDSWVEVRDRDNKIIFSQRSSAGTEQTLSGQGPFSLVVGYAPGVRVFWHGEAVDLAPHARGDVARLVLE